MDASIFQDKTEQPDIGMLRNAIGNAYECWEAVKNYVFEKYPKALEEWNFANKYGWSCRLKDNKRAIVYLLPRDKFFKVAFVFGQKAYDEIMSSQIADEIKKELQIAKVYAEGRGIRIAITDGQLIPDIKMLVDIKLKY